MLERFWVLIIALLSLTACSLDINMLGKSSVASTTPSDGTFPLGEKAVLFGSPVRMERLSDGKIVLFDGSGSGVVKVVNAQFQNLYTVATYGSTDGKISGVRDIAIDSQDNIYVTDGNNYRVQKFAADGTFLAKWGGTHSATPASANDFAVIWGMVIDSHDNIYVANASYNDGLAEVKVYNTSGQLLRTLGTFDDGVTCAGCAGYLSMVSTMAIDANDNLFVYDQWVNKIHKFDSAGNPVAVFGSNGTGNGQFSGSDIALSVSPGGELFAAQYTPARVQKFDLNGNYVSDFSSAGSGTGQLGGPAAIIYDSNGDVIISDLSIGQLGKMLRYTSTGTYISKIQPGGSGDGELAAPYTVAVNSKYMVAADLPNKRIVVWDKDGKWLRNIGTPGGWGNGHFNMPMQVGIDSSDNIYVFDVDQAASPPLMMIQVFDVAGNFLRQWNGSAGAGGEIHSSNGFTVAPNGDVYVLDGTQGKIQKFNSSGTHIVDLAVGTYSMMTGLAAGLNNNLFVGNYNFTTGGEIFEISSTDPNAAQIDWFGSGTVTGMVAGIAVTPGTGEIQVVDMIYNKVYQFSSSHTLLRSWGQYGVEVGSFSTPFGIAAAADGTVYVADVLNCRVQRFNSLGIPY